VTDVRPAVGFYHLTRDPVEVAVPKLLERVIRDGYKVLVCAGSAEQVEKLDTVLWTYEKDSFLPHGTDRNDALDLQTVLLTANGKLAEAAPNSATVLLMLDNVLPEALGPFQRFLYMFDGGVEAQVQTARRHWKELKDKGLPLTYWQQTETGGWKKEAEA
jgi:DNA polymerase III subunit chi